MCDFCEGEKSIILKNEQDEAAIKSIVGGIIKGRTFSVSALVQTAAVIAPIFVFETVEFNYCPMCGRKLD